MTSGKPRTIDGYLAALPDDPRATLQTIRETLRALLPDAVEGFSYGMPAFLLNGKPVAGFSASKRHCGYYPMSGSVVADLEDDLAEYETSKGAVRFPVDEPLPAALVEKLVRARIAEIEAGGRR